LVLQDANYNVLGVTYAGGKLVERYEYTPYGRRTVYSHGLNLADFNNDGAVDIQDNMRLAGDYGTGDPASPADATGDGQVSTPDLTLMAGQYGWSAPADDPLVSTPRLGTHRLDSTYYGGPLAGLCEQGHQGLTHDEEFGLVYNRHRYLAPALGRFCQRDPAGYVDGMNLYEYLRATPPVGVDPLGLVGIGPLNIYSRNGDAQLMITLSSIVTHLSVVSSYSFRIGDDVEEIETTLYTYDAHSRNRPLNPGTWYIPIDADPLISSLSSTGRGRLIVETDCDGTAHTSVRASDEYTSTSNVIGGRIYVTHESGGAAPVVMMNTDNIVTYRQLELGSGVQGNNRRVRSFVATVDAWNATHSWGAFSGGPTASVDIPGLWLTRNPPLRSALTVPGHYGSSFAFSGPNRWFGPRAPIDIFVRWTIGLGGYTVTPDPVGQVVGGLSYTIHLP